MSPSGKHSENCEKIDSFWPGWSPALSFPVSEKLFYSWQRLNSV